MSIKVYTAEEVAEVLQMSRIAIYSYIKSGALKAVKIGKGWRISEENLRDFINNGSPILDENRRRKPKQKND